MDWQYDISEDMKEKIKKLFPQSIYKSSQEINGTLIKQKAKYRKKYGKEWPTEIYKATDFNEKELNGYLLLNLYSNYIEWLVGTVRVSYQDKFGDYMPRGKFESLWDKFMGAQQED